MKKETEHMKGLEWAWALVVVIFMGILIALGVNHYRYGSHRAELAKEVKDYQEVALKRIKSAVIQSFEGRGSDCGRGYARLIGELYQDRYNAQSLSKILCALMRNFDRDMPDQEYSKTARRAVLDCDNLSGLLHVLDNNDGIDLAKAREIFDEAREDFESCAEKLRV